MKKTNPHYLIGIGALCTLLTGCASIIDTQTEKKQLADGTTVRVGYDLKPTAAWHCKQIGDRIGYKWSDLKSENTSMLDGFKVAGNSALSKEHTVLMEKAIAQANHQQIQPNYINIEVPERKSFNVSTPVYSQKFNLRPNATAYVVYYQCEKINPEGKLAWQRGEGSSGFKIGS